MPRNRSVNAVRLILCLPTLALLAGCPANLNRVPGSTEELTESETGGRYLLYVPSWHTNDQRWPVVVTCHGTIPFDTADLQLREWRGLAERVGFLVVAPRLSATNGMTVASAKDQIAGQQEDEAIILNAVRRTITSLNGDPDRVYMVGWSGGAYAVYYTGLRNPSVFRALAVRMGTFHPDFLPDLAPRLDPYQPIAIFFAAGDPLPGVNAQCRQAADFLENLGASRVFPREVTGGHRRRPEVAFDFFKEMTRDYALVRPSAVTGVGGDPLEVQFYLKVDPPPRAVLWDFGDGRTGATMNPRHHYDGPGSYTATVIVVTARGAKAQRKLTVGVGE